MNKKTFQQKFTQYFLISFGVVLMNIGFYFFLDPINLCMGGVMGLATILKPFYSKLGSWFTTSIFIYMADIICLIIGAIFLGRDFFLKTIYATLFSPTVVLLLEKTCDPYFFLNNISDFSVVDGMVNAGTSTYIVCVSCSIILVGAGIGISIKNNGSTGGIDVVQKILSKYFHIPYSYTVYMTDWVIVFIAGFSIFHGDMSFGYNIETVLFASLGVVGNGYVIDTIVLNAKSRRTAYIITSKPDEIKNIIYEKINRGVTYSKVEGSYTGESYTMLICTMDKNEAYKIMPMVEECDPKAFSFVTSCKEVKGEYDDNSQFFRKKR